MPAPLQRSHAFLATNQATTRLLFNVTWIALLAVIVIALFVFTQSPAQYGAVVSLGNNLGITALIFYILTLIPGIMQRLRVSSIIRSSLMLFRRQFGVTMFMTALAHGSLVYVVPLAVSGNLFPYQLVWGPLFGQVALLILLPLWLTSNDLSVERLGPWWKRIHRLTYLALVFIFLHVILQSPHWWVKILGGTALALEALSWAKVWWQHSINRRRATIAPHGAAESNQPDQSE